MSSRTVSYFKCLLGATVIAATAACSSQPWKISSVKALEYPGNCFIGQGQLVVPDQGAVNFWNGQTNQNSKCATAAITVVPTDPSKPLPDHLRLFTVFEFLGTPNVLTFIANYEIAHPSTENVFNIVTFIAPGATAFEIAKKDNYGFPLTLGNNVEVTKKEYRFFAGNNNLVPQ